MFSDYDCPYCNAPQNYNSDGLSEDETEEMTCSACERQFLITCQVSVSYDAEKADCLDNESLHRFEDTHRFPFVINDKVLTRCPTCQREQSRPATDADRARDSHA